MVSAFIFSSTWPTFDLDIALYINYIKYLCLYILFSFTFYNMYTASLRFWSIVMFQFLIRCSEAIFLMSIIHRTRFDNSIVLSDIFHFSQIKYTTDRRSRDILFLACLSFCHTVLLLANNFSTVSATAFIFHMNIPCDETFPLVPLFFTL